MKKLSLAIALAGLFAAPAMAADMPVKAVYKAPPVYVFSWTGCFIGGNGGGVWVRKDYTVAAPFGNFGPVATNLGSHDANSGIYGVQAGCDYQFAGGWVVGIQGDYDWTRANGNHVDLAFPAWSHSSNTRSLASVTGRLGYAWDRFLGYVRGGYAWERDNYNYYLTAAPNTVLAIANETRGGWTIGVGGEYAFANWVSMFVEYDYYNFGTRTNQFVDGFGAPYGSLDIRERKSVIKAGLNLRWGGGAVVAAY